MSLALDGEGKGVGGLAAMMGGRSGSRQWSVVEGFLGRPLVPEGSIYHLVAHAPAAQFEDAAFAGAYAERGRPSYPPSLMAKMLLLSYHDKTSDEQAEERCRYDIRWKYALGLEMNEQGPDKTTICRFRSRLIANEQAGSVFFAILRWAREHKVLAAKIDEIVDATSVHGAGAVQDTMTLIRKATRKLAHRLCQHPEHGEWARGVLSEPDDKPDIDWNDKAAQRQALNQLVAAGQQALERTAATELDQQQAQARELLQTVLGQDVEAAPEGGVRIRQGVAKDRICSVTDPQMRHGHKTSKGRFDGHKAEIGMDKATELITHVDVMAGNGTDGEHMAERMAECEQAVGVEIERVTADTAYGRPAVREEMAKRGTDLLAPVAAPANRGLFTKDDFQIDLQGRCCICPNGDAGRPRLNRAGDLRAFQFAAKHCQRCPLRAQCTTSRNGRLVQIHPDEAERQRLRAEQQDPAWQKLYHQRPRIEGKIAELVGHGMRRTRYIGRVKAQLQLYFTAAVVNLKRLGKLSQGGSLPNLAIS
jgi:IS5 family transposase